MDQTQEQPQPYEGSIDVPCVGGGFTTLKIECEQIIARDHLAKNIALNLQRDVPRFLARPNLGVIRDEPLAIIAAGPSVRETIEIAKGFRNILVCGSAHDFARRAGIVPTFALVSDGGKEDKGNLSLAHPDTIFLIASQCDPSLFDHLKNNKVEIWNYRGQSCETLEQEAELLRGEGSIAWGSTVTINSVSIALFLGFQYLHFFGFDCAYGDHGLAHHCCEIAGSMEYKKIPVTVPSEGPNQRLFISDLSLAAQAEQFFKLVESHGQYFHSTIYGDGLLAEMVKRGDPELLKYVTLAS